MRGVHRPGYMREYRARKVIEREGGGLLPFQREFLAAVTRRDNRPEIAACSVGRGNGKTFLAGALLAKALKPSDDPLYVEGAESVLVSASRPMATLTLEAARLVLGDDPEFRWRRDGVSSARILACGTIAPAVVGSWWQTFIEAGSGPGVHIQLIQGDEETWRDWDAVLAANPCTAINPNLVRTLKREHDEALSSDRAASAFLRFRMNINAPEATHAQPLTSSEWERVCARPVPACEGKPVVAVDLGGNRSWSAACGIWPAGRIESWASAPGEPSLSDQEHQDQVMGGTYSEVGEVGRFECRRWPPLGLLRSRVLCLRRRSSKRI